ncbi:MAG TPA: GlsB/YeaQ/YmgE family stress response membrane protein [Caulobacteraceae bacterium]|nr:GlsB/YeaQ/YmgE family stress response membrane protein [Caulobacteraceae bacterium]
MSIIAWLILGLVAGFIASKIVNKSGEGLVMDIVLGIVGAFVGGWVFTRFFHGGGVTGLNLYSLFVSVVGAIGVLLLYHLVVRRRQV